MSQRASPIPLPAPIASSALPHSTRPTQSANVWQLTHNELFKLWKRRMVWGLLALDLFLVFGAWCVLVFYAAKSQDSFQASHLLGSPDALSYAIGQPLTLGRRGGEFIALALGGLAFGGEFNSGAIRLIFSRGVNRTSYLFAKSLALAIACLALVIAGLLMGSILTNLLLFIHQPAPTLLKMDGHTLGTLLGMSLGIYENFLFCMLLGAAVSIIARSAAFGITAGFGYLIGEDIAAKILPVIGKSLHTQWGNQLINLLFTPNLNALYSNSLPSFLAKTLDQLDGVVACNRVTAHLCSPLSSERSLIVVIIWVLILGGISAYMFIKRDVLQ